MDFDIKLFKQLKENKDVKKLHETEDRIKTPEELKDEAYQYFQDCKMVPTFEDIMDYVASALEVQHNIIIDDDKYKELAKELEEEGKKTLLWGFQKERTKEEADNEKEKPKE